MTKLNVSFIVVFYIFIFLLLCYLIYNCLKIREFHINNNNLIAEHFIVDNNLNNQVNPNFLNPNLINQYLINQNQINQNNINEDLSNVLESTPPFTMVEVINDDKYECSICLEDIKNYVCVLNCEHSCHDKCIRVWAYIKNNNNCPLCRKTIVEIEV